MWGDNQCREMTRDWRMLWRCIPGADVRLHDLSMAEDGGTHTEYIAAEPTSSIIGDNGIANEPDSDRGRR